MHDEQGTVFEQRVFLRAHSVHVVTGLWLRRIDNSSDMVNGLVVLQTATRPWMGNAHSRAIRRADGELRKYQLLATTANDMMTFCIPLLH